MRPVAGAVLVALIVAAWPHLGDAQMPGPGRHGGRPQRAPRPGGSTPQPAEALRAAPRALIVDYPPPFAWAGFGLTGVPW